MRFIGQIVNNVKTNFSNDGEIYVVADDLYIENVTSDKDLIFKTNDGGTATEVMRIDGSTSNVGIATSSPATKFEVVDVAGGGLRLSHTNGEYVQMRNSGSVAYLENTNTPLFIEPGADLRLNATNSGADIYLDANGFIKFREAGVDIMAIDGNKVGIGTTSPASKLHVAGTVQVGVDDTGHDVKFFGATSGRFLHWDESADALFLVDNVQLRLGTGGDLKLYHTGTGSVIQNAVGNLTIQQDQNDGDIIFRSDDGSGGTTPYLTLDGGVGYTTVQKQIRFDDSVPAKFGTGNDLHIFHDGTDSLVDNYTGDLYFRQTTNDKDIIFQSDDGSGGLAAYFQLDGSDVVTLFSKPSRHIDNVKAMFGNSNDLSVFHDATDSRIQNAVGDLYITNTADDKDVILRSDDGSGGVAIYMMLDGSEGRISTKVNNRFDDSARLELGTSGDLDLYHDGSHSYINNVTGNIVIRNQTDDGDIVFQADNGSGGDTTYLTLDGSAGYTVATKRIRLNDSVNLGLGSSNDLDLYHNATNSFVENWTGDLYIRNNANDKDVIFQSDDGSGGLATYLTLDGSTTRNVLHQHTEIADGKAFYVGAGLDGGFYSDGANVFLEASNGDMTIANYTNDKDIIFQSDDGSGGVETYFFLDGSAGAGTPITNFPDGSYLTFGGSQDIQMFHDGTNNYLQATTGDLYIRNLANDKDVIFQSDDGSGGVETYFFLDGSRSSGNPYTVFPDNSRLLFGGGGDLELFHNGSNSYLRSNTAFDILIQQGGTDKDIILQADNGSGSPTAYLTLDGSATTTVFAKNTRIEDSVLHQFGSSNDMAIYHNGTDSFITNDTGDLRIRQFANDKDIIFDCDDGSGGVENYIQIDGSEGRTLFNKHLRVNDSVELQVGASADMKIFHDGNNSNIENHTAALFITNRQDNGDIIFKSDDGSGGVATYLTLDGGYSTPQLIVPDGVALVVGTGLDFNILHNGSNTTLTNNTGNLTIKNNTDDGDIILQSDDGSGGTATYLALDGGLGRIFVHKRLQLQDSIPIYLGTGSDDFLYHNGSNSFWTHQTGDLTIESNQDDGDIIFKNDDGSGGITAYLTLDGGNVSTIINTVKVLMPNLPTSDPSVANELWNDSGTLKISAG